MGENDVSRCSVVSLLKVMCLKKNEPDLEIHPKHPSSRDPMKPEPQELLVKDREGMWVELKQEV